MSRKWVKLWCKEILHGTTSTELLPDERCIWFSFLAMAGDSPVEGTICLAEKVPYTDDQLAQILNCESELIARAKSKMIEVEKIEVNGTGAIVIANWKRYQSEYSRQKPYREKLHHEVTEKVTEESYSKSDGLILSSSYVSNKDNIGTNYNNVYKNVYSKYLQLCGGTTNQINSQLFNELCDEFGKEKVDEALEKAKVNKAVRPHPNYLRTIILGTMEEKEKGGAGWDPRKSPAFTQDWSDQYADVRK